MNPLTKDKDIINRYNSNLIDYNIIHNTNKYSKRTTKILKQKQLKYNKLQ